jgi:hypothetical protein
MHIHYGPGYRFYINQRGAEFVVLLCGGDKSTQATDINLARKSASVFGELSAAKARPFDAAEYLDSPEMIAAYLTEALESNDQALITKAIGACPRNDGGRGKGECLQRKPLSYPGR